MCGYEIGAFYEIGAAISLADELLVHITQPPSGQ
jgi:hypothetical protein